MRVGCEGEMQILQKWNDVRPELDEPYGTELRSSRLRSSLPRHCGESCGYSADIWRLQWHGSVLHHGEFVWT
jgi:hypothetical protein